MPQWARISLLIGLGLIGYASFSEGAVCTPNPDIVCPANTICSTWNAPTTRGSGAPLLASEIRGYELSIDARVLPLITGLRYDYALAQDEKLTTSTVFSIVVIDTDGNRSDPTSCTLSKAVSGPKSRPGAPGNVRVQ